MKAKKTNAAAAKPRASRRSGLKAAPPVTRKPARHGKCVICGSAVAPFSSEDLCWVCRRLKISAWREADNQPSVQE